MNKDRCLLILSGPSGSGKDTVVKRLQELYSGIELSVSATTRDKRIGEKEAVSYFFISKESFEEKIAKGKMLEYTSYCGNYYGTPKSEIDSRLENGVTTLLVIEVQGASNIKRIYPECTTIFVNPPSFEELSRRLHLRGTENEDMITARLSRAREEMTYAKDYDYVVTNNEVDECAKEIYDILHYRQSEL